MATMQRRLVHKQFNSPINLYSQRNIQETLDRELKQLSNGAIGIDFDDPSTTKPPSLAKSAVLQALEDEERQQSRAGKGLKRVAWPPPAELGDGEYQHQQPVQQQQQQPPYHYPPQQHPAHQQPLQQNYPQQQQYQQPHTQPQQHQPRERIIPIQRATSHTSPAHTPKSPVNQLKYPSYPPSSPHQTPHYPTHQQPQGGSSTVAFSGGRAVPPHKQQQQPARPVSAPYYQQQQQQQNRYSSPSTASLASPRSPQIIGGGQSPRGWAHVQSPVPVYRPTPQQYQQQQQQQQQQYVPPPFQTQPAQYQQQQRPTSAGAGYGHGYGPRKPEPSTQQPQYQPQPTQAFQPLVSAQQQQQQQQQQQLYQQPEDVPQQHQQFYHTTAADSQIPFVTTLRKEAPMSQEPAPVYHTEPVAAIYQGGTNMRGDQKWPPADYKKQSELDNEERLKLAHQPAFRPRKVQKDYSDFFAKNALNATYPGYRAPPGTQHHS